MNTTNTAADVYTLDHVSAFDLETIARQIWDACPAMSFAMKRVCVDLEVAHRALRANDVDACIEAIDRAAAFVWCRSHSAYRAIMATFEA